MVSRELPLRLLRSRIALPRKTWGPKISPRLPPTRVSPFSTYPSQRMMELSGFTEEELTVKEAINKICANFPNEYWRDHDNTSTDPWELHAALAKDGWLGIALPEELGGAGLGKSS